MITTNFSGYRIIDQFTRKKMSRQRKWQLRHKARGLCVQCNQPAVSKSFCLKHLIAAREESRRRLGATKRHTGAHSYKLSKGCNHESK